MQSTKYEYLKQKPFHSGAVWPGAKWQSSTGPSDIKIKKEITGPIC